MQEVEPLHRIVVVRGRFSISERQAETWNFKNVIIV